MRVIALFRKRVNDMKKATRELSRGAFWTNCRSAPVPFVLLKTNKFPARGLLLVLGRAKRRVLSRALLVACQVDPAVTHRRRFRIISHARQGLCPQQSSNRIDPCVPHYALNYLNQVSRLSCPLMTCPQPCRNLRPRWRVAKMQNDQGHRDLQAGKSERARYRHRRNPASSWLPENRCF